MTVAVYQNNYQINPSTGEVLYDFRDYYPGPFSVDDNPDSLGNVTVDTGSELLAYIVAGTDADNNIFADEGYAYFTNDTYEVGDFIPDYVENYALRDTSPYVACFLADTMISTPQGPFAIQHMAIGDMILTADGCAVPVKWMGRQAVAVIFNQAEDRAPICIDAGALGGNLPTRDLKLTADHALLLDGVLVQAGALVNGSTIRRMPKAETGDRYTVFHIETEGHEIILAEGCPAETFVDNVTRARFDNYDEYLELYGEEGAAIAEIDLPRVKSARQLPKSLRDLIAVRRAA